MAPTINSWTHTPLSDVRVHLAPRVLLLLAAMVPLRPALLPAALLAEQERRRDDQPGGAVGIVDRQGH
eukprot:6322381-Prymnesium_polylepis.1